MLRLTSDTRGALCAIAEKKSDREIAAIFRERNASEVTHLDDEALLSAITSARATADKLGLTDARMRMRFIMLDTVRLPGFWRDPEIWQLLTAPSGSPEIRFGDVCTLIKLGATRAGASNYVWWQ